MDDLASSVAAEANDNGDLYTAAKGSRSVMKPECQEAHNVESISEIQALDIFGTLILKYAAYGKGSYCMRLTEVAEDQALHDFMI